MTTQEKCEAIVRSMLEHANAGRPVMIEEDMGGDTATVYVGKAHTHVGVPDPDTFCVLVDHLHNALTGGPGLSFYQPPEVKPNA